MKIEITNATCLLQLRALKRNMRLPYTQIVYMAVNRLYTDYKAGNIRWEERQ